MQIFKTDSGATYIVEESDGILSFTGERVGLTHTSIDNRIVTTGKVRNQGTMGGVFPFSVGMGQRAILFFDTGEGITEIRGVLLR